MKSTLLTRRQIIEKWQKQKPEFQDSYCCPKCRDILRKSDYIENMYYCDNDFCQVREVVKLN